MIEHRVSALPLPEASEHRARRRLRRVGAFALVALGLAGGCFVTLPLATFVVWVTGSYLLFGDEGLEHVAQTVQAHEELPAPGPPPTAPVARRDAEGTAQAARYFIASYEYGYTSGDSAWIEELPTPRCATCASAVRAIDLADQQGARFLMMDFEPTAVTVSSFTPERAAVHLSVTVSDAALANSDGDIADLGGGNVENDVVLVWKDGHWLVDSLDGGLRAPGQHA